MSYRTRNILFLIIKLMFYMSVAAAVAFLVLSFFEPGGFLKWILRSGIALFAAVIFFIADIFRKSRFPVAGRDYL